MSRFDISGKVVIVTGAGMNIGREYAQVLAAEGAKVVVADIVEDPGRETVDLIEKDGGTAAFVRTDVTDEASTVAMAAFAAEQYGSLDALVNNAGIWGGLEFEDPTEISLPLWEKVQSVNVTGMFLASRAVIPHLEAAGGGVIINQSSIGAYLGGPFMSHYCTSKGAVNALTRALARDLGDRNIRVNAIAPGVIGTQSTLTNVSEDFLDALEAQQCIKRKGGTEDLMGPLLFLLSDASQFVSGQVLVVDGGMILLG